MLKNSGAQKKEGSLMHEEHDHLQTDSNSHTHKHTHSYGHSHEHKHGNAHSHEHKHDNGHSHDHVHTHDHSHAETSGASAKDAALLKYMLDHNKQHAFELSEAGSRLASAGLADVAELINDAVHYFDHANEKLENAVTMIGGDV